MIKILFVIGATKSGGAEKRAILISKLLKSKFDTHVFAFHGDKTEDIDYVFKKTYSEYKKCSLVNRIKVLKEYLDVVQPDVVVSFVPHINFFATRALSEKRFKHIKHIVAMVFHNFRFPNNVLLRYSINRADAVYYQCLEQSQLIPCHCYKMIMYNPINISDSPDKLFKYKFMSAGRLEDQKDYDFQIRSFELIKKEFPNATLDIYGNGKQKDNLITLIKELDLLDSVRIWEYTDNINSVYDEHDVFLFTTKYEGFPNVLIEAMSHKLICFSTHFTTGCKEILIDGKTGFVSKNRDINSYSKMVISNLKQYQASKIVANNGYEHIKDICDTKKFVSDFEEGIYEIKTRN